MAKPFYVLHAPEMVRLMAPMAGGVSKTQPFPLLQDKMKIFVTNLGTGNAAASREQIHGLFSEYGHVTNVYLKNNYA